MLRPDIAIVTRVGTDHWKAFRSREAIATEKAELPAAVPATGTVILNMDDPLVMGMTARVKGRLVTIGTVEGADYRAVDIDARLPDALTLTVEAGGDSHRITTRLYGAHWHVAVLSAIAAARETGIDWETIREVIAETAGMTGHCTLHTHEGRHFLLDVGKAPAQDLQQIFAMLKDADAPRRTIVFAQLSDFPGEDRRWYRRAYELAAENCDRVIIMRAPGASRVRVPEEDVASGFCLRAETWQDVAAILRDTAMPGEIVMLKSAKIEHLERAYFDLVEPVTCTIPRCGRWHGCYICKDLRSDNPPTRRDRKIDAAIT